MRKIGCLISGMRKSDLAHDIIKVFSIWKPSIYEIAAPLYQKGLSITEIANEMGLKRTAIWKALRNKRDKLHPKDPVPYERWRKSHMGRLHSLSGNAFDLAFLDSMISHILRRYIWDKRLWTNLR